MREGKKEGNLIIARIDEDLAVHLLTNFRFMKRKGRG